MGIDVLANSCFQLASAVEDATSQLLLGQESKPTLDEVEPRGAGRGEMELKTWTFQQPALNGRSLMSTVVVEDQMDVELWRHLRINLIQELTKLNRAMSPVELANHLAALRVQGGEQRSGAVTFVVMSPAFDLPR